MKRSPLARGDTPLKRTPLARVSEKRKAAMPEVIAFRAAVLERAKGCCERCGVRAGDDLHAHHMVSRSRGRNWPGLHKPENGAALCSACHRAVHETRAHDWRRWVHILPPPQG